METIARLKISLVLLMLTTACKGLGVFPEQADASSPNSTLEDFTITDTLGEETTWIMRGASALLKGEDADRIEAQEIDAEIYNESGENTSLKAGQGVFSRTDGTMIASQGVVIVYGAKEIHTSDVEWIPEENVFVTDSEVRIVTPEGEVRGTGMRASKDLEDISLLSRISGSFSEN